jgi:hypothetical protein
MLLTLGLSIFVSAIMLSFKYYSCGWAASSALLEQYQHLLQLFSVGAVNTDHSVNADAEAYVAYCFAEKQGYSESLVLTDGNASTDGAYVHLGFKPALVIFKVLSDPNDGWSMIDNKRSPSNLMNDDLYANSTAAEVTNANNIDFLSNGFKCRGSTYPANAGGSKYFSLHGICRKSIRNINRNPSYG